MMKSFGTIKIIFNITNKAMKLFETIKKLFPVKHDFNLDEPIQDEITVTHQYKLSGHIRSNILYVTGFKCRKCGDILWLDKAEMGRLPRGMKYGCKN